MIKIFVLCNVLGGSFEEYYMKADKALYHVKQNGKNSFHFYEELAEQ